MTSGDTWRSELGSNSVGLIPKPSSDGSTGIGGRNE
ncbi:hypothetical protein QE397_000067 [Rhodococcus sp. SORGH_AS 301]|nr:hypothetical protein [Rhodococcus sp. SORGH_AS_0301]